MALLDNKKTKMLLVAAVGAFALSAGAVANLTPVSAEVTPTNIESFVMQDGAGVRTDDQKAIRFTTAIDKSALNTLISENEDKEIAVVTMITPTNVLGETALTNETFLAETDFSQVETVKFRGDRLTAVQGKWNSEKAVYDTIVNGEENAEYDKYVFRACLYDIKDANLTYDFSARSYITVDGEVYDYTDYNATDNSRNIWNVAKNALENGNYENTEAENEPYDNLALLCAEYDVKVTNGYTGEEKTFTVKRGDKISYENATEFDAFTANVEYQAYLKDLTTSEGVYEDSIVTSDLELTANYRSLAFTLNGESYTADLGTYSAADNAMVIIPETYNGKSVTAFTAPQGQEGFTHVVLPASITTLTTSFQLWTSLEYMAMPGVTDYSEHNGFLQCNKLTTLIVGNSFNSSNQVFKYWATEDTTAKMTIYTTSEKVITPTLDSRNDMWNEQVVAYSKDAVTCGTWGWANEAHTEITVNENTHSYDSTTCICANCGDVTFNAYGVKYTLNDGGESYSVSAYDGVTPIVKIFEEYEGKPVTAITGNIFSGKTSLVELYLPETITAMPKLELCSKLEVLSMPGVKTASSGNYALRCYALKTLIVGNSFTVSGQVFHCDKDTYVAQMTIYSTVASNCSVSFDTSLNGSYPRNNTWDGTIVYYNENGACGTWKWANEAHTDIAVNENTHSYDSETGVCANCGDFKSYGITYEYVEATGTYKASVWDQKTSIVKIYESYDDGVHGRKDVTAIEFKMFNMNPKNEVLKELYLPETITTMPYLEWCSVLEVLSMPGVTSANQNDGYANCGHKLTALRVLIVGSSFSSDGQVFYITKTGANNQATVYTTATSDATISFTGTNNNIWNGTIVYYSEDETAENTWQWADDGMGIVLNGTAA